MKRYALVGLCVAVSMILCACGAQVRSSGQPVVPAPTTAIVVSSDATIIASGSGDSMHTVMSFTTNVSGALLHWAYQCSDVTHEVFGFMIERDGKDIRAVDPKVLALNGQGVELLEQKGSYRLVFLSECPWAVVVEHS